jgi:hypothetical protein
MWIICKAFLRSACGQSVLTKFIVKISAVLNCTTLNAEAPILLAAVMSWTLDILFIISLSKIDDVIKS